MEEQGLFEGSIKKPMLRNPRFALGVILVHLAVTVVHGRAHSLLHISLTYLQQVFVFVVILAGPLLAGILLLFKAQRAAAVLLLLSMVGSLAFGAYNHFVVTGADNALHVAPGAWGTAFQITSILLVMTEMLGCWAGIALLRAQE